MKKILLDTNAYTALMAGDVAVLNALATAEITYLSIFVIAELFSGFKGGLKEKQNRELFDRFLGKPTVRILSATMETAEIFATVKDFLRTADTPIPINDVWIAAHSLETGSVLISFDRHFEGIPGLRIWEK
jgi:tRNA(fMet)-specific endonuclease VapC